MKTIDQEITDILDELQEQYAGSFEWQPYHDFDYVDGNRDEIYIRTKGKELLDKTVESLEHIINAGVLTINTDVSSEEDEDGAEWFEWTYNVEHHIGILHGHNLQTYYAVLTLPSTVKLSDLMYVYRNGVANVDGFYLEYSKPVLDIVPGCDISIRHNIWPSIEMGVSPFVDLWRSYTCSYKPDIVEWLQDGGVDLPDDYFEYDGDSPNDYSEELWSWFQNTEWVQEEYYNQHEDDIAATYPETAVFTIAEYRVQHMVFHSQTYGWVAMTLKDAPYDNVMRDIKAILTPAPAMLYVSATGDIRPVDAQEYRDIRRTRTPIEITTIQ